MTLQLQVFAQSADCRKDSDFSKIAEKVVSEVDSNWDSLKMAIASELFPQYVEDSNHSLTIDEFFARLILKTIDYDAKDVFYTIFWSDAGLFGGHSIQVLWDPEREFRVDISLVG